MKSEARNRDAVEYSENGLFPSFQEGGTITSFTSARGSCASYPSLAPPFTFASWRGGIERLDARRLCSLAVSPCWPRKFIVGMRVSELASQSPWPFTLAGSWESGSDKKHASVRRHNGPVSVGGAAARWSHQGNKQPPVIRRTASPPSQRLQLAHGDVNPFCFSAEPVHLVLAWPRARVSGEHLSICSVRDDPTPASSRRGCSCHIPTARIPR